MPKENQGKESSGRLTVKKEKVQLLYAVAEHPLVGFLEDEPDLYSDADVKLRYR